MQHIAIPLPRSPHASRRLSGLAVDLLADAPAREVAREFEGHSVEPGAFRRIAVLIAGGCLEIRVDARVDGAAYDAEHGVITVASEAMLGRSRGRGAFLRAAAEAAACLGGPAAPATRAAIGRAAEAAWHVAADTALFADLASGLAALSMQAAGR